MKVAVNLRLPNGSVKTLVYGAKNVVKACAKAKKEHPTWEIVRVSVSGEEASRYFERELKKAREAGADEELAYAWSRTREAICSTVLELRKRQSEVECRSKEEIE